MHHLVCDSGMDTGGALWAIQCSCQDARRNHDTDDREARAWQCRVQERRGSDATATSTRNQDVPNNIQLQHIRRVLPHIPNVRVWHERQTNRVRGMYPESNGQKSTFSESLTRSSMEQAIRILVEEMWRRYNRNSGEQCP